MNNRELLQKAHEALGSCYCASFEAKKIQSIAKEIETALAQPEQEAAAWMVIESDGLKALYLFEPKNDFLHQHHNLPVKIYPAYIKYQA